MRKSDLTIKFALLALFTTLLCPSQNVRAAYQVLVLDKDVKSDLRTVWSDGIESRHLGQAIVFLNGHLQRLYAQNFSEHVSCPSGKFPFYYQVDKLICEPVSAHESRVLLGDDAVASAKDVLRDHQASCDGMKPMPYRSDTEPSYEKTKFNILSLYGDLLGVEQITESFSYGRPQPLISLDWSMYRMDKNGLSKVNTKVLPATLTAKAQAKFSHLSAKEKEPYAPGDFDHFVFRPQGAGMAVDFALPGTQDISRKIVKLVEVEKPDGLGSPSDLKKSAFVISHSKLLDWKRLQVYDIAPDNSAVVYVEGNGLYWLTPGKAAKKLDEVKSIDGIQWFNSASVGGKDINALKHGE